MNGFYAGAFDPFTNGNLEVVKQASKVFETVFVCVIDSPLKERKFSSEVMKIVMQKYFKENNLINVSVFVSDRVRADDLRKCKVTTLIRDPINKEDYEAEKNREKLNKEIYDLDTIYFGSNAFEEVDYDKVNDLIIAVKEVSKFVPGKILEEIPLSALNRKKEV